MQPNDATPAQNAADSHRTMTCSRDIVCLSFQRDGDAEPVALETRLTERRNGAASPSNTAMRYEQLHEFVSVARLLGASREQIDGALGDNAKDASNSFRFSA